MKYNRAERCGGPRPLLRQKILIDGGLDLYQSFVGENTSFD